jgi:chitinase
VAQQAVDSGVNVLIWSFFGYSEEEHEDPIIQSSLNLTCIRELRQSLTATFLVSTGGWNGGHLNDKYTSQQLFDTWKSWSGDLFDGIDFDLEGNDNLSSPWNEFTVTCLDTMGTMSRLAKQDGYNISLAPPQSYLDFESSQFNRFVNLTRPTLNADFEYYGANVYAYVMAQYGQYVDIVMIQLYESYSRAHFAVTQLGQSRAEYLRELVQSHVEHNESWFMHFEDDPTVGLPNQLVTVPLEKLVVGFANGWAWNNPDRVLFVSPHDIPQAVVHKLRGFMIWTLNLEGLYGLYLTKGLAQVLFGDARTSY